MEQVLFILLCLVGTEAELCSIREELLLVVLVAPVQTSWTTEGWLHANKHQRV